MAGYENEAEEMKLSDGNKRKLVSSIVKSYQSLLKSRSKNNDKAKAARDTFLADMGTCLYFGVSNLRDKLQTDRVRSNLGVAVEDLDFLDDQLGPRKTWAMSSKEDREFAARKAANLKRKLPPVSKSAAQPSEASTSHDGDGHEDISIEEEDKENEDPDFEVNTKSRKKASDRITVSIPRNLVGPSLASSLDRTKESSYSAMRNLSALISSFQTPEGNKVELEEFNLSRSSIERERQKERQRISLQAKVEFLENLPENLALHWDGSMMEDLLGIKNEVEAILASGGYEKYKEGKLLDVIELKDKDGKNTSTGEAQAKAVYATILDWGILVAIRAFVFDTTASNTGWHSGACVRLNFLLGRVILWLACRHHINELLAKNPFNAVVGYDPSPDVAIFVRMKNLFPSLDTTGPFLTFTLEAEQQAELIQTYTEILTKQGEDNKLLAREDYRELAEISLVMVGGQLPGGQSIRWRPPGACHKARFILFKESLLSIFDSPL